LEFGGAKSLLFRDLGGLAPPSPYVEPPLSILPTLAFGIAINSRN